MNSLQNTGIVSSFAEIARDKDIDRDRLQLIIADVFRGMIRKRYGSDEAFQITLNPDHGDIQILHVREVVENYSLEDPVTEIELKDALLIDEYVDTRERVAEEISLEMFGRRAVVTARQNLRQRIKDIEKENIFEEYTNRVGEIVVGEVYQTRHSLVLVMHNRVELVLPRNEQIPRDRYRKGDMIRAVVKEVRRDPGRFNVQVIISRSDPKLMERLFELEVPEIDEGEVEIKRIEREPGERAKVAVISHDDRIDPVGACVGLKGNRIHSVVRELSNENIDVMEWSEDPVTLISRALSPARPVEITLNEELDPPRAKAVVKSDEVSQAIGKGGINIRLATRMSGYEIDIYREIPAGEEDINIDEFDDEIDQETLQKLKDIGCDTAKVVLELSIEELVRRSGLEVEVAERVMDIIKAEFAQDDDHYDD